MLFLILILETVIFLIYSGYYAGIPLLNKFQKPKNLDDRNFTKIGRSGSQ